MTTVQCAQCKAPYAVFGVEPPLEYVCGDCTTGAELEAGITRAENDLAEARMVARKLFRAYVHRVAQLQYVKPYPWLSETD